MSKPQTQFLRVPYALIDNPAIHSDAELGFIVRLARKAEHFEYEATLPDGSRCRLAPGEIIVAERDLAERAGVHRTTIRRLLERLERAGLCDRRCANQRSSNGTILTWTFLKQNQEVKDGCRTDVKPSSEPSCDQTVADSEPSINIDIDSRYQITDSLASSEAQFRTVVGSADGSVRNLENDLFGAAIPESTPEEHDESDDLPDEETGRRLTTLEKVQKMGYKSKAAFLAEKFDTFWAEFPARRGSSSKDKALRLFVKAVRAAVNPDRIIQGAICFQKNCVEDGTASPDRKRISGKVPMASTWLNLEDRMWEAAVEDYEERLRNPPPPNNVHHLPMRNNRQQAQHKAATGPRRKFRFRTTSTSSTRSSA
jgi:hypothetical protein